ncbi:MAG: SCP2 sterol-binding domain-containing protein [Asgard group archaeon]|nr:SCP2 sterol-binding domain-containing protein [Asgard group archaeon]
MPSDEEIINEINKIKIKLADEKLAKHFKSWNKTMQYYFPDVDAHFYLKLENGVPGEVVKGKVEKPEISYEITTEDFFALNRGEISGLKLYNQKRLKIKASMPDIIKLQKLN